MEILTLLLGMLVGIAFNNLGSSKCNKECYLKGYNAGINLHPKGCCKVPDLGDTEAEEFIGKKNCEECKEEIEELQKSNLD